MKPDTISNMRAPHAAIIAASALALVYGACGLVAMWFAPRVPYADVWRSLAHFLQSSFPRDVLAPDNGHHAVLPNLVRVIDLHVFAAQQGLQVVVGIALALATLLVLWRAIGSQAHAGIRAAVALVIMIGLFWFGSVRTLMHGNESVHAYAVTLFLALGLYVLTQAWRSAPATTASTTDAALASSCAMAAAFSFGSGIACFAAFAAVLALQRASWRAWCVLLAGLLLTVLLLHWSGGTGVPLRLAPLQQFEQWLRWLAGPFVYASWPLLDPAIAAQIPVPALRVAAVTIAQGYAAWFGPVMLARWPHLLIGAGGLLWLCIVGWRAWRQRQPGALAAVGLACFGAAVGAMIVLVRGGYFEALPEQLLASRYVVWSSLFWAGLALAAIVQARHATRARALAIAVALLLLPSQAWMARYGTHMRAVAERTAVAAVDGVIDPDLPLGETVPAELTAALPLLRKADAAMFAWPEARWLGRRPGAAQIVTLDARDVDVAAVSNRIGPAGRRVTFTLRDASNRLLLLDADGVVRGLAIRDGRGAQWVGWMHGIGSSAAPQVVRLAD